MAKIIYRGRLSMGLTLTVDENYQPTVTDGEEEYTLYKVAGAVGGFVGQVRTEVEEVLARLRPAFVAPQTVALLDFVRRRYGDEPEFLWERSPGNAIVRRKDNRKWYLALLTLEPAKLGLCGEGTVEVANLRADRSALGPWALPGFHMNKKNWITVVLNGEVPTETLCALVEQSYRLVKGK